LDYIPRVKLLLAIAVAFLLCACPANNTAQPVPPSPPPSAGYEPPEPDEPPPPPPVEDPDASVAEAPPPASGPKPDGSACLAASDCASNVCEGLGCGADTPGVCAPAKRGCTKDRRAYCNCAGITFYGSGSCPGQRYSAKAACPNG
jgi:hypothetical protein